MSDAAAVTVTAEGIEYRASALGGCDKALLAARLGYDAIPVSEGSKILEVFEAGHRIEDEVIKEIGHVLGQQSEVRLKITERISVVGHIDGHLPNEDVILEIKSQNKAAWDLFEAKHWDDGLFPKYKWQASVYMLALDRRMKLIRALRDEDGQWTGDMAMSYVDVPFYTVDDIRRRILTIEAAAHTGVLIASCTNDYPCPYFYLHDEIDRELIDDEAVDILAREYDRSRREHAAAKGRLENARKALRAGVEGQKLKTKTGVLVTFYEAANPPQLDREMMTGFLKLHERELDEFMKRGKSERLRVTLPKEKN